MRRGCVGGRRLRREGQSFSSAPVHLKVRHRLRGCMPGPPLENRASAMRLQPWESGIESATKFAKYDGCSPLCRKQPGRASRVALRRGQGGARGGCRAHWTARQGDLCLRRVGSHDQPAFREGRDHGIRGAAARISSGPLRGGWRVRLHNRRNSGPRDGLPDHARRSSAADGAEGSGHTARCQAVSHGVQAARMRRGDGDAGSGLPRRAAA